MQLHMMTLLDVFSVAKITLFFLSQISLSVCKKALSVNYLYVLSYGETVLNDTPISSPSLLAEMAMRLVCH